MIFKILKMKKNFFKSIFKNDKFSQNLISRPDYHLKNYLKKIINETTR